MQSRNSNIDLKLLFVEDINKCRSGDGGCAATLRSICPRRRSNRTQAMRGYVYWCASFLLLFEPVSYKYLNHSQAERIVSQNAYF